MITTNSDVGLQGVVIGTWINCQ